MKKTGAKAPSMSGNSRMSGAGASEMGRSSSGVQRSSMFTFVPPAIELNEQYKEEDAWSRLAVSFSRPVAIAESDAGLCDYAPDQKTWWMDALNPEGVTARELRGAWRLQRTLREALAVLIAHNWRALSTSLATLASTLAARNDHEEGDE